ncbi:hypothetical protein BJY04DRAFT_101890 [Aspergillus karnatakaensis]|uniref:uncharacterized protein n=1 Tax=Aspergillus karnatakaensis TaxID=1810916 RepID=UPI003CCDEDBC
MTFNITIGPGPHDSDDSSFSDEEDSSGVQVSPPSESESHGYHDPYDEWTNLPYPDELKPSDSASRNRTSYRTRSRNPVHPPSASTSRRRSARRQIVPERESFQRRSRRQPSPESPESMDSAEEYGEPYPPRRSRERYWQPVTQGSGYAHSLSPGPSYVYPNGPVSHTPFAPPTGQHTPSDQLVRVGAHSQVGTSNQYGHPFYGYNPQLQQQPQSPPVSQYYMHDQHPANHGHIVPAGSHRGDGHNPLQHPFQPPGASHGAPPYGGPQTNHHELVPYGAGGYYPFREPYAMVPGMIPPFFNPYARAPSPPSQTESAAALVSPDPAPAPAPAPAAPPADAAKDEAIARLEKLILDERTEREARDAREAASKAAAEAEAAAEAAQKERAAHEKKIVEEAAAQAKAEAEQKAADEAAKAKKEAEEAAAKAAETAAAEATEKATADVQEKIAAAVAANKPPEKPKPIKFKDALGRKFSFPFDLCCTWKGMEELIKQAFLHIEVIGPHVAEGHYDLVGPNGDIILPQVWETVLEPDWSITMHMWPIPEKPKPDEPAAPADGGTGDAAVPGDAPPPADAPKKPGTKKPRPKNGDPGILTMWMVGGPNRFKKQPLKVVKKPKAADHAASRRVV